MYVYNMDLKRFYNEVYNKCNWYLREKHCPSYALYTLYAPRLMFGSLRSLWIFVDPTSDKPNINEDDFTYDDAENEIVMLTNTEETIPAGMRHNKKKTKGQKSSQIFL